MYESQQHCCAVTGEFVPFGEFILHHKKNKCQGGQDTFENAEGRSADAENWAHRVDIFGNPTAKQIQEYCEAKENGNPESEIPERHSTRSERSTLLRSRGRTRGWWRVRGMHPS